MPEIILNTAGITRTTGTDDPVISGNTRKSGPLSDIPDGTEVAYHRCYSSNKSGFENCIGIWRAATSTIERTSVEKSSNENEAVVWTSSEQTINITVNVAMLTGLGGSTTVDTVADMVAFTGADIGDYIQVQSYTATNNSGVLTFVAVALATGTADGGSYIDGDGVQWKQLFSGDINAASFGVGDGVDDAARLQNAINYVRTTHGGGVVTINGEAVLEATVTVKVNVSLVGAVTFPGGWKANTVYGSVLTVEAGASIALEAGASIIGVHINKDGVTYPQSQAQVAAWTDTAITGTGAVGSYVKNCMITSFAEAVNILGGARFSMDTVFIDCLAGIVLENSVDVNRFTDVHIWPFISDGVGTPAVDNERTGTGIHLTGQGSWAKLQGCFVIGHAINLNFTNTSDISIDNCAFDYGTRSVNALVKHIVIDGAAINTRISDSTFGGDCTTGILIDIDSSSNDDAVQISDCSFHGANAVDQIYITDAQIVTVVGCQVNGGTSGITIDGNTGVNLEVSGCSFSDLTNVLKNVSTGFTSNNVRWNADNIIIGTPTNYWLNAVDSAPTPVAATTFKVPTKSDYLRISGTTTITALANAFPNRRVTFYFIDGLTMNNTSTIKLLTGANTSYAAGAQTSFICTGAAWYEV